MTPRALRALALAALADGHLRRDPPPGVVARSVEELERALADPRCSEVIIAPAGAADDALPGAGGPEGNPLLAPDERAPAGTPPGAGGVVPM